jgi:multiple sugar transport system substrate-binding protein
MRPFIPIRLLCLLSLSLLASCDRLRGVSTPLETAQEETAPANATPVSTTPAPPVETEAIPNSTATLQTVVALNVSAEELKGTIIRFWHPWTGPEGDVMKQMVEEFNLSNEWKIVVVPTAYAGLDELNAGIRAALQSGEPPHLSVGSQHQILGWDAISPLTDLRPLIDDPRWGLTSTEQADFYPSFWEQDTYEGRRLGIPALRSAQVLFYNSSWAQALGFGVPPVTPQQFMDQACAAARANRLDDTVENDSTGGLIVSADYAAALSWIYSFGGEVLKMPEPSRGQTVYQFTNPQVEQAFNFLRALYDGGCAWFTEEPYPEAEFAGRSGLFAIDSLANIPYQAQAFGHAGNRDGWTVIPFPSPIQAPAVDAYGASYVMFASTPPQQLAAWLFMKWLASPSNHARLVEVSSSFPLCASELSYLEGYKNRYPQWNAALKLIPSARGEPPFPSWGVVRWALSDATTQLFRSYFTTDQVPTLLNYLDRTASEIHVGPEMSGVYDTPTYTPSPTLTPTRTRIPSLTPTPTRTPYPSLTPTPSPTLTLPPP